MERTAAAHSIQAHQQGVNLRLVEPTGPLPPILVDPERMAQVLSNLVVNALRYTPAGGEISLEAAQEGSKLCLLVRDNGAGIRPEDLPHIFRRFYRSDKSRPSDGESGLGLAIVRSIVAAHGGQVSAASVLGEGTAFTITLVVWSFSRLVVWSFGRLVV